MLGEAVVDAIAWAASPGHVYRNHGLGSALMLIGSSLVATSLVYQKQAHAFREGKEGTNFRSARWLFAAAAFLAGNVVVFFGQGMLPQIYSACFGGYTLGLSVILSAHLLGEAVHQRTLYGIACVIAGIILTAWASPRDAKVLPELSTFAAKTAHPVFVLVHSVVLALLCGFIVINRTPSLQAKLSIPSGHALGWAHALLAALGSELISTCTKVISDTGLATAVYGGGLVDVPPKLLGLLAVAGTAACFQVYCLNVALAYARAVEALPLYYAFDILLGAVVGMALFDDLATLGALPRCAIFTAVAALIGGILCILSGVSHASWAGSKTFSPERAPLLQ